MQGLRSRYADQTGKYILKTFWHCFLVSMKVKMNGQKYDEFMKMMTQRLKNVGGSGRNRIKW